MSINNYITYTSMQSIIQDIHSMVDSIDWDQDKMLEWAVKGLRKLNLPAKYEDCVVFLEVVNHVSELPNDIKYINQMFYREVFKCIDDIIEEINEAIGITPDKTFYSHMAYPDGMAYRILDSMMFSQSYRPLRKSTHSHGVSPCVQENIPSFACPATYTIFDKCAVQTSFKDGCIALSYKRYVKDCDGYDMVPDDENLKDALYHFCMYRWWLSRSTYKEEGAERQMMFHYKQYELLAKKAVANLNSPDTDTMENIKNYRDRLVPRSNMYDTGFGSLSNRENLDSNGRYHTRHPYSW